MIITSEFFLSEILATSKLFTCLPLPPSFLHSCDSFCERPRYKMEMHWFIFLLQTSMSSVFNFENKWMTFDIFYQYGLVSCFLHRRSKWNHFDLPTSIPFRFIVWRSRQLWVNNDNVRSPLSQKIRETFVSLFWGRAPSVCLCLLREDAD